MRVWSTVPIWMDTEFSVKAYPLGRSFLSVNQ